MYGSKYYLENLSLEEHSGIIADINFDMLGGNHLRIGTVNGFESALSIYLEQLTGYEYELSDKGSSSDSDPFMYWQIPAVTFIDSDLPAAPCEDVSYLDYVSDESFDSLALQLADIINGFDIAEFAAAKSSQIVTEYNEKDLKWQVYRSKHSDLQSRILSFMKMGFHLVTAVIIYQKMDVAFQYSRYPK